MTQTGPPPRGNPHDRHRPPLRSAQPSERRTTSTGVVYMLHFKRPWRHARHYVGWTDDLPARLATHKAGHGARLVAVIVAAGIGFELARTVAGDRNLERATKNAGGAVRYCPICTPTPRNGKWAHPARAA